MAVPSRRLVDALRDDSYRAEAASRRSVLAVHMDVFLISTTIAAISAGLAARAHRPTEALGGAPELSSRRA